MPRPSLPVRPPLPPCPDNCDSHGPWCWPPLSGCCDDCPGEAETEEDERVTADEQASRLVEAERYFRRMASGCEHFGSTQMAIALMAEYDARADRGASLELEERAHAATSAEVARLEAENARLRAELAYAADPLNWDGVWTADPDAPLSHGNLVELYHGTGQVLWTLRPRGGEHDA